MDLPGLNALVKGRHGYFVVNKNDKHIGASLRTYGEYSEGEVRLFQRLCRPGDVAVDAGANIGAHTVALARLVGEGGCVVAFEPQPVIFQMLCANVAVNGLTNVIARHAALGAAADRVIFPWIDYAAVQDYGAVPLLNASQGVYVDVRALDAVFEFDHLRFLKIDVEGMEADVLRGARQVIERTRPFLYVENNLPEKSEELIRLVWSLGYRAYWHMPPMFNRDNFFGHSQDIFGNLYSLNMLCVPQAAAFDSQNLALVTDPTAHPKRR
jgi:FkbM family methyltransferase